MCKLCSDYQLREFVRYCQELPEEAIVYCIDEAAMAPRPSLKYWRAIAQRIIAQGWAGTGAWQRNYGQSRGATVWAMNHDFDRENPRNDDPLWAVRDLM